MSTAWSRFMSMVYDLAYGRLLMLSSASHCVWITEYPHTILIDKKGALIRKEH